jgi:hypothetical protein
LFAIIFELCNLVSIAKKDQIKYRASQKRAIQLRDCIAQQGLHCFISEKAQPSESNLGSYGDQLSRYELVYDIPEVRDKLRNAGYELCYVENEPNDASSDAYYTEQFSRPVRSHL